MIKTPFCLEYFFRGVRKFITLCCCFVFSSFYLFCQGDSNYIKNLYDRALDFSETKMDSIKIMAELIETRSNMLGFDKGELLSSRLKGIYAEYSGDYNNAINHYLRCLEISKEMRLEIYEASALSDLAYLYSNIKNPEKAKEYYLETAKISLKRAEVGAVVTDLCNLGAIYNQIGQPDSALYFLEMAAQSATGFTDQLDLTTLRNNMGNAWFQKKEWQKAQGFFRLNYEANRLKEDKEVLWYDVLNMSDVFIELQQFDSAKLFLDESIKLAKELGSERKEADAYQLLAKYHHRRNNFKEAFQALQKWNTIDTSLVNAETRATLLQMEERFHLKQRANENELLVTQIEAEQLRSRNISYLAFAIGGLALITGVFLYLIRKKNSKLQEKNILIQEQNERLAELNTEKNSLISVVSHDLNTPFSSIKMWVQLLESEKNEMKESQVKAVDRIKSSVDNGLLLIRNILDVERVQTNSNGVELDRFDLFPFLKTVLCDHEPTARRKEITIHFNEDKKPLLILSDRQMLSRVFSNLISNAIKFTPRGKNIYITVNNNRENIDFIIRDEGLGIAPDEMKYLFTKYSKISTLSTEGESSTGLGLSIVKRILTELNGSISCISEPGTGSTFTVKLPV